MSEEYVRLQHAEQAYRQGLISLAEVERARSTRRAPPPPRAVEPSQASLERAADAYYDECVAFHEQQYAEALLRLQRQADKNSLFQRLQRTYRVRVEVMWHRHWFRISAGITAVTGDHAKRDALARCMELGFQAARILEVSGE